MKLLLTLIVLLYSQHYAIADITLEFNEVINKNHVIFKLKDSQLKFFHTGHPRFNTYNRKNQNFISINTKSGKKSIITPTLLNKRISQLNQQRLKKLAQVEQKLKKELKNMSAKDREHAESLINFLKYPDIYGEHTQLNLKKSKQSKKINDIPCQVYQFYRKKDRIKEVCIAQANTLKMSANDYKTLRSFYAFNYSMQTRLMLAMGKTRFNLIDYEEEKITGIMIESIDYIGDKISQHLVLDSIDTQLIEKL